MPSDAALSGMVANGWTGTAVSSGSSAAAEPDRITSASPPAISPPAGFARLR
ncbi:MAG: hypothetical protein LBR72_01945 [Oscillospiraceae bacterium]|nr:hypothetical protein [Oscillospiraceae bacterium]